MVIPLATKEKQFLKDQDPQPWIPEHLGSIKIRVWKLFLIFYKRSNKHWTFIYEKMY